MVYSPRHYTARQLLAILERDVVLRGRLPMFSELAYRSDGPTVEVYLDLLGEGDWGSLQIGLSAWLTARGYHLDDEGNLVSKSPPPPPPPSAPKSAPEAPPAPLSAREIRALAQREKAKPKPVLKKKASTFKPTDTSDKDWSKVKIDTLLDECLRGIDRRFPPATAKGQQLIGHKLVTALGAMIKGQPFTFEDGRQLVRTLTGLIHPESIANQLTVPPLFWQDDPIGGLIALANGTLYGERDLLPIAVGVELLHLSHAAFVDLLSCNALSLIYTRAYALSRAEVSAMLDERAPSPSGTSPA